MKLWLLLLIDTSGFGMCDGLVIRAKDEDAARILAANRLVKYHVSNYEDQWLDLTKTTCEEVALAGEADVILESWCE